MAQRKRKYRDGMNAQEFREKILDAAAEQFAARTYVQTTMSSIAHAVGIDQSSLYHWFSSKAEVASSLLQRANDPLAFLGGTTLEQATASVGARAVLIAAVFHDARNLCLSRLDYYELESAVAQARGTASDDEPYRQLAATLTGLVAIGEATGELHPVGDARSTAFAILTMDEGLQHRFRQGQNGDAATGGEGAESALDGDAIDASAATDDADANPVMTDADSCARFAARCALRLVGASDDDIDCAWSDARTAGWVG